MPQIRLADRHADVLRRVPRGVRAAAGQLRRVGLAAAVPGRLPLLYIALWIRPPVGESPLFERLLAEDELASSPVRDVVLRAFPQLVVGACAYFLGVGGFYLATTFVISYGTGTLHLSRTLVLTPRLVAAVVESACWWSAGRLSERFGPARITVLGGLASAVVAFPVFLMIDTKVAGLVRARVTLGVACLSSRTRCPGRCWPSCSRPSCATAGWRSRPNTPAS